MQIWYTRTAIYGLTVTIIQLDISWLFEYNVSYIDFTGNNIKWNYSYLKFQ